MAEITKNRKGISKVDDRWSKNAMIAVSKETRNRLKEKASKLGISVKKLLEIFANEK